jgi:purine-nucleoside phosphorylase
MIPFRGNIYGTVESQPFDLPMSLDSYTLSNRHGAAVGYGVYLIKGARNVSISAVGTTISSTGLITDEIKRVVEVGEVVRLVTEGSIDYDFEFSNIQPPI